MTGPDCAVMCNSINTHTHLHLVTKLFDPPSDRRTHASVFSLAGPYCVVMCNLTHTLKHQQDGTQEAERGTQDTVVYCTVLYCTVVYCTVL